MIEYNRYISATTPNPKAALLKSAVEIVICIDTDITREIQIIPMRIPHFLNDIIPFQNPEKAAHQHDKIGILSLLLFSMLPLELFILIR